MAAAVAVVSIPLAGTGHGEAERGKRSRGEAVREGREAEEKASGARRRGERLRRQVAMRASADGVEATRRDGDGGS